MKIYDSLWVNANIATLATPENYGIIHDGAIAISGNKISWIGPEHELPEEIKQNVKKIIPAHHKWITPGLIDCHTHLVYAGNRAHEFELRLMGKSYQEIAEAGNGILSTVMATRESSEPELLYQTRKRLKAMLQQGVTTIEIKSGYGLDLDTEIKCLKVAKNLAKEFPITIKTTYLGAHCLPPEYKNKPDDYINFICDTVLPILKQENLIDAVDGFCEKIAFSPAQIAKVFDKATSLGLPVKLHAEQLSNQKAAILAAKYHALSADHLEYIDENGVKALAEAGTVAVLLPGAFYFLREKQLPPIQLLQDYHVPIAIATDCNPGTSPINSLLLIANMACTLFRLTPLAALQAITLNAAKALGLEQNCGSLAVGKTADFVIWDISSPIDLIYQIGFNPCLNVIKDGVITHGHIS